MTNDKLNSKHCGAGLIGDNNKHNELLCRPQIWLSAMNQLILSSSLRLRFLFVSHHLINTPTPLTVHSAAPGHSAPLSQTGGHWPSLCMSMCLAAAQVSTQ